MDNNCNNITTAREVNHNSDFKLMEKPGEGQGGDLSAAPFVFNYYTAPGCFYTARHCGDEWVNCKPMDDGSLMVIFDRHGLRPGKLMCERRFYLTDQDYADGTCDLVDNRYTGVRLTTGATGGTDIDVQLPPYYQQGPQGEPMTWDKMTAEQKQELVAMAVEAMGGRVYEYNTDTFTLSKLMWLAKGLRYVFFREIKDDTACYLLTTERCMKFDIDTLQVAWDVELPDGSGSWHNANLYGRVIGDTVYVAKAKYPINHEGFVICKLNDADGSLISAEEIPIGTAITFDNFIKKSVLMTAAGYTAVDYDTKKVLFCDAATLETTELAQLPSQPKQQLLWITKPDGTVMLALVTFCTEGLITLFTEDGDVLKVQITAHTGSTLDASTFCAYYFNFSSTGKYYDLYCCFYDYYKYFKAQMQPQEDGSYTLDLTNKGTDTGKNNFDKEIFVNSPFTAGNVEAQNTISTLKASASSWERRYQGVAPIFFPSPKYSSAYLNVATDSISQSLSYVVSHLQLLSAIQPYS